MTNHLNDLVLFLTFKFWKTNNLNLYYKGLSGYQDIVQTVHELIYCILTT